MESGVPHGSGTGRASIHAFPPLVGELLANPLCTSVRNLPGMLSLSGSPRIRTGTVQLLKLPSLPLD